MRSRVLLVVVALTLPFVPAVTLAASADEGSPVAPTPVSPPLRPPLAVLRHVDAPVASPPAEYREMPTRELVVLVGGYQSCACPDDGTFTALQRRLTSDPRLDVVRFGADPQFPYDSYGPVAPNATRLRDQIRSLAPGYTGVHIVTHSMGGVVADRAFDLGLSPADGVVTYVSLAAPHSGSDAARAMTITRALTGDAGAAFRESLLWLGMEADSSAVGDLARARPIPPPKDVVRLDLREMSDVLVTERDARDPGVPSRILTKAIEGHGGILEDPEAIDQTMRTIVERRVPPDERSRVLLAAAQQGSERTGGIVLVTLCALAIVVCLSALAIRAPIVAPFSNALGAFLPRASRKPCP